MAKEKETATAEGASGVVVSIKGQNGKELNVAQLLDQMNKAEVGQELGSDYFTLEPGEMARVIFTEMTQMNKMGGAPGEMTDAVNLIGADGRQKICADKVIVTTCRGLANKGENPCPVQITCTGKVKGQNGTYKEFVINKLLIG